MTSGSGDSEVRELYQNLLQRWNERDAAGMAGLYAEDGSQVGFDGSQLNGRAEIAEHLSQIFAEHKTAAYVGIVRELRLLSPEVALLRAVAGMLLDGATKLDPATNTVQSLVAVKKAGVWKVALFHNTPAAFHGRPQESEKLTDELRRELHASLSD